MPKLKENLNLIIAFFITAAIAVAAGIFFDFYFDLNDDVLMKDILSGAFTGVPEGRNIQMLYPISALISLFYRLSSAFDWYGIFLCGAEFACFFLIIAYSLQKLWSDRLRAVLVVACEVAIFVGFYGPHMIFVQYTVICGLLSSTAAFLIVVAGDKDRLPNILAVVFLFAAYLLRSEMMLLTLPAVMVAVLIKWRLSGQKELFKKYLLLVLAIMASVAAGALINKMAYSSAEWKEFYRFFDNRTELYDFQYVPEYVGNEEFYEEIGLSESEQKLLINYNFGLDDEINADILGKIAAYADSLKTEEKPVMERLKSAFSLYFYRLRHIVLPKGYEYPMSDFPWNVGTFALYLGAFLILLFNEPLKIYLLVTLFACRTSLWVYIIYRGRDPIRITHPLYLCEMLILLGMIATCHNREKKYEILPLLLLLLAGIVTVPTQIMVTKAESDRRSSMRADYGALYDYFEANSDSFYLMDVYTSVSYASVQGTDVATFSEKMFENVDNSFANHDLMGGWASKSPLVTKKLQRAGLGSMEEALLKKNVFFVQNKTEDIRWLMDYYSEKGIDIAIEQKDLIADIFAVYQVERLDDNE